MALTLVVFVDLGLDRGAPVLRRQANRQGLFAGHGGIETQRHGPQRQAGGLGVFALAGELE